MKCKYGECNGRNCLDCEEADDQPKVILNEHDAMLAIEMGWLREDQIIISYPVGLFDPPPGPPMNRRFA